MNNLTQWAKQDNLAMKVLKVNELRHIICSTDKGDLSLMLRKGGTERDYRFILDAVPLDEAKNKELMQLFNGTLFTI